MGKKFLLYGFSSLGWLTYRQATVPQRSVVGMNKRKSSNDEAEL